MTSEPQKLIVLSGLPGSGKSTLAEGLSRILSVPVFSIDPIEAAMWRGGLSRDQTGIAAYEVAQSLAAEHLRLGHSVLIDAVNPVEAPRAAWRRLAAKYRADLKIIECICVDQAIHRRRIEARTAMLREWPRSVGPGSSSDVPNMRHGPMSGSRWTPRCSSRSNCSRKRSVTWSERAGPCCAKAGHGGGSALVFVRQSAARWIGSQRIRGRADLDAIACDGVVRCVIGHTRGWRRPFWR